MLELDGTLLVAIISFIIFAFIMNAVLYQPIMKIMEERKAFLENNALVEESSNTEAQQIMEQKEKELTETRMAASKNVSQNSEQIKAEQRKITEEFTKIQKEKTAEEKQNLLNEVSSAKEEIKQEVNNIADIICEKFLGGNNV